MEMEKEISILNIDDILPNRFQPRIHFNDKNINELADSIKEHGVIQPIVVRKISDKFEIIAGERRYKASILAGKTTIPAIITNLDDKNSAEIALIENVQRQDLTPIEEAVSYKKILDMGYLKQGDLAEKLGKTQSTIANKLRLLNLDEEVQESLLEGKISERHARSLLRLDLKNQIVMLNRIIDERLTVRKTDEEIDKMLSSSSDNQKIIVESEVKDMNEKVINQFNIPVSPIIEEPNLEQHTQINPGFMDVNKIENQAEDIFKQEKTADLSMLLEKAQANNDSLESMTMQPIQPVQPIQEETKQEAPSSGKFFTMFNLSGGEENNDNYIEDIESKEVNMDFGVPNPVSNNFNELITPAVEKTNIIESKNELEYENNIPNVFENNSVFNGSNVSSFNEIKSDQNLVNNNYNESPKEEVTAFEVNDTPVITNSTPENNYNPFGETNFQEISTSFENQQISPNNFEPEIEVNPEFKQINPFVLNEDSEFTNTNNQNFNLENNKYEDYETDELEVKIDQTPEKGADIRTVINLIRECSNQIEKLGYVIDTEEIDFESVYQVTIKINK